MLSSRGLQSVMYHTSIPAHQWNLLKKVSNHVILLIHVQSWCFTLLFPASWLLFPLFPGCTPVQLHGNESFCWSKRGEASRKIGALITPPNQVVRNAIDTALSHARSSVDMWVEITAVLMTKADWFLPLQHREPSTTQGSSTFTLVTLEFSFPEQSQRIRELLWASLWLLKAGLRVSAQCHT